jgi:signal transduction histidine kinase
MVARPRLLWGDKINLGLLLAFQVIAVVVLASVPLMAEDWLKSVPIFSTFQRWIYFYIPYFSGLVFLICSVWVFSERREDAVGQVFSLFTSTAAIGLFCLFDVYTSQRLTDLWVFSIALSGGALINLALLFPIRGGIDQQYPFARYLGYFPAVAFVLLSLVFQYHPTLISGVSTFGILACVFITLALFFFTGSTLVRLFDSPSPNVQAQARLLLWSLLIAFGPVLAWLLLYLTESDTQVTPFIFLTVNIFPACLAYAILRYRLLGTRYLFNRALLYGALMVIAAVSYALLVSGLGVIFGDFLQGNNAILVGGVVFLIALLIYPLRAGFEKQLDAVFFRGQEVYQESLQSFGRELTKVIDLEGIIGLLREYIERAASPSPFYVYLLDTSNNYYEAVTDKADSEIHFSRNGALVQLLTQQGATIFLGDESEVPVSLQVDQARLAVLGAKLFVPMLGQSGMVGWLALGTQNSGEPYSSQIIDYMDSLCDQASLALERAQVVATLEQRINEMDAITHVAQEINQKSIFSELLEMFYNQTRSLIPTFDFQITLKNNQGEGLQHVYYCENGSRDTIKENSPGLVEKSLAAEVVRNGQALVTVDYVSECRQRGLIPESSGIIAWMGVPLIAGTETIGAVSLGSRDPELIYSSEQVNLLQAIADLASGAIVKARLLAESQKQTHQLATLNELTRSLTSTLDLDPLLTRIMENAVEILNCEAGSLLLVDDQTGESVFEVAIGPVGTDLKGQRLPPGVGMVGKAVKTKQAIIQNDVQGSEDWFNTDEQTGYSSKDLLVVPLIVKDEVIGVLEILNKKDASPFDSKDQDLLTAFAGQAAIAIENARLYTQTDQALADRVYELSVMQRIDRELNASLEIERVLSITLRWSILHSKASAGLIGLIKKGALQVFAAEGYSEEQLKRATTLLTVDNLNLNNVATNNESEARLKPDAGSAPYSHTQTVEKVNEGGTDNVLLLPYAQSQLCVSIRREAGTIGLIFLETASSYGFSDDTSAFLSRLSDHAAIAVANAELYSEIQKANIAKSEFVSAAAHELKNPLTSIKGYSDLLVGGAVGQVSSEQAGFLSTIRSNAERMRTLVSDLQDMSRIDAGQLRLQISKVSLVEAVNEVVKTLENQIQEKDQTLDIRILDDLPLIRGDDSRLNQILTNLVSNANKYSPIGSQIELRAELAENQLVNEGSDQFIHITVSDKGIGISEADQQQIFQQFFRSDEAQVREATGTGLGLSIAKQLVEMQGGRIWFESELGAGTVFHFTLPVAVDD